MNELQDIQNQIDELKSALKLLLEQKQFIMREDAREAGCTCGFMVLDWDARRVVNAYCPVHIHARPAQKEQE